MSRRPLSQMLKPINPKTEGVTEGMEQVHAAPPQKTKARTKRPVYYTGVRRSARIQNTPKRTSQNRNIPPLEITITESESESESDQEEEPPRLEENMEEPAIPGEKTLEEKLEYAVQLLETMGTQVDNRGSDSNELRYRNMYFESQKQNEALKKKNRELSKKLEVALAKLEGFEKGSNASLEWMSKFKDVVTSLSKASPMDVQCQYPKGASSSKRRKLP